MNEKEEVFRNRCSFNTIQRSEHAFSRSTNTDSAPGDILSAIPSSSGRACAQEEQGQGILSHPRPHIQGLQHMSRCRWPPGDTSGATWPCLRWPLCSERYPMACMGMALCRGNHLKHPSQPASTIAPCYTVRVLPPLHTTGQDQGWTFWKMCE